jgi:protein-S-isoprenylcysteine O-methyltransferase Ste14
VKVAALHFAARGWTLAAALLALLVARAVSETADAPLRPAWLLLVLAGIILRAWAGAHLGTHGNAARAQAPALATGGPYRFSRNPLYLSNILVAAGLILYANAFSLFVSIAFILIVALHHAFLIRHEESVLAGRFGEAYDGYRRDVSRWIGPRGSRARGVKRDHANGGGPLKTVLSRQGRNVGYALACVLSIWVAARWF